ncbi:uncharacterized protein G2W53_044973 [Senna tora]|uniref:Uncharacterized protein n=1 Tax=Senna tora TaxID=362788 RepID=A0A834SCP4_9FABA|nr:uncharacterized protein G2W53_044973 [Senna tora]
MEERGSCLTYSGRQIAVGSQNPSRITRQKTCCDNESNTVGLRCIREPEWFDALIGASWHGRSVDHVLTYSGRQIAVGSQKPSRVTRQKTCCASESNTSVRVVFANQSGFDAPIRVVFAGRSVDRVLTCSGRQIAVGSQKPSRITRKKTCCPSKLNTSVRVVFANRSGFDARLESSWHGRRGSCLTYSGRQSRSDLRNLHELRGKRLVAQVSHMSVRVVFANRSGFDAPIGVVLAWERGSCLNLFRTTNRGRISETFTNYEAKRLVAQVSQTRRFALYSRTGVVLMLLGVVLHGRSVDRVLTYSGQQIAVGSQKPSRITRQKTCCAMSQTRRFALYSRTRVFDAPIRVFLAWEECGSCLNIYGRQIAVGSQKPSRITRQKLVAQVSQTRRFALYSRNRFGFDAPIGVVLAWEERGSCPNIFRTTNRGRISETFTNYEAKDLLRK